MRWAVPPLCGDLAAVQFAIVLTGGDAPSRETKFADPRCSMLWACSRVLLMPSLREYDRISVHLILL